MGFWLTMLICDLSVPLIMIFGGLMMYRHPPKKINGVYGYRTSRSMKNMQTWRFAHRCCGRLWQRLGVVLLVLTIAAMAALARSDMQLAGILTVVVLGVQMIALFASIFKVEAELKLNFDERGNPKN